MQQLQNPAIARVVVDNFNMLTASGMKWHRLHPQPNVYDFSEGDWNVHFAKLNNMRVHGHNLCWNNPQDYPGWLKDTADKSNARDLLESHINTVVTHYRGQIDSWDVVNEPVVPWSKRGDGLYPGIWPSLLGPDYINIAFQATHHADPAAVRVLNIYRVEEGIPDDALNRTYALALIRRLLEQQVPLQAVGIESHLDAANPLDLPAFTRFLKEIRALGLEIMITECDVLENRTGEPASGWDRVVADRYQAYLHAVLDAANPRTIIFWSLLDRWEEQRKVQGLFEPDLRPRASYHAVQSVLSNSCAR